MGRTTGRTIAFGLAYFLCAAVPIALTRFQGGVALVWIASALLTARLHSVPAKDWPAFLGAGAFASFLATGLFGLGWQAAGPLALINVCEAAVVAWFYRRVDQRRSYNNTSFAALLAAACIAGPLASMLPGAYVGAITTGTPFWENAKNWLIGHSLGMLAFAPVFLHLMRASIAGWFRIAARHSSFMDLSLLALVIATTWATFSQSSYPLLFLPVLTLVVFVYCTGFLGAALGTAVVAAIGGIFTARGFGPVALIHGSPVTAAHIFQAYVAATELTLLPVAASLTARRDVHRRLQQSEDRYRLVTDNITDIVMVLDVAGRFTYVAPSIRNYAELTPDALIGTSALDLIDPEFHDLAREKHLQMLHNRGLPVIYEYIGATGDGRCRWFETSGRATFDEIGSPVAIVATVRETSQRKLLLSELSAAARTDVGTRLLNRRAFFDEASKVLKSGVGGCIALLDIDQFKTINDYHGHEAGDNVLRNFATAALESIRIGDAMARMGGEEFALILPGISLKEGTAICERVLEVTARLETQWGQKRISMRASAGIARIDGSLDLTLQAADRALVKAKKLGGARLSVAP